MKQKFTIELRDENKVPFGTIEVMLTPKEFETRGSLMVAASGATFGKVSMNGAPYYMFYVK